MERKGMKIFIIDDDKGVVDSIKNIIGDKYYIDGCISSKEGLKRLKEEKFDILILDYYIDELNANDIIDAIRKYNNELYIILFTGYAGEITGVESLENLNIQNYYEKDANFEKFMIFMQGIIKSLEFCSNKRSTTSERLKKLRKISNLTQDDIAKYLNVHRTAITQYESGETMPSIQNIIKLAKLYNVTTDYVLCYELNVEK